VRQVLIDKDTRLLLARMGYSDSFLVAYKCKNGDLSPLGVASGLNGSGIEVQLGAAAGQYMCRAEDIEPYMEHDRKLIGVSISML